MKYLDSSRLSDFLTRFPECFPPLDARQVGAKRMVDSGYHSIVRFFGRDSVNPDKLHVQVTPGRFAFTDPQVAQFAAYIAHRLAEQGRLYDGPTVAGVTSLRLEAGEGILTIQETSYRDFAGSLFALDLPYPAFAPYGGTLRDYYVQQYGRLPLEQRPLANCLGVCGHLVIEENDRIWLLQVRRAGRLATLADTIGPSAAGSVDFASDYTTVADILQRALGQEVREELVLEPHEFDIIPLACAREIFRGDNPQLFGLIRCHVPCDTISRRLESIPASEREFSESSFLLLETSKRLPAEAVDRMNFEARMSYYLLEEYLESVK